jgi:hypothetical protein
VWAVLFQVAAFAVQAARTFELPKVFKDVGKTEAELTNGDHEDTSPKSPIKKKDAPNSPKSPIKKEDAPNSPKSPIKKKDVPDKKKNAPKPDAPIKAPPTKKPSHATPHKIIDRLFSLSSATLAGAASNCIQMSLPQEEETVKDAMYLTLVLLVVFLVLGVVFFKFRKKLNSSETDEDKDGLTDMTPNELALLTLDEGINNFTAAIAAVIAAVWFALAPVQDGQLICWTFVIGLIILLFGEWIQLELTKGSMAEYVWQLLNGLNQGNVSWFIGLAMSNYTEHSFGADNAGRASRLRYWHWFVGLVLGVCLMEVFDVLSSKMPKTAASKAYGSFIVGMLKGIPMYSSGWILNDLVQYRWDHEYIEGTIVWCCMSAVLVTFFDQILHLRSAGTCFGMLPQDDAKFLYGMTNDTVSLLQQTFAFICGNMAGFIDLPFTGNSAGWVVWAVLFQVAAFAVQAARTFELPKVFKAVDAREANLSNGDYILLNSA